MAQTQVRSAQIGDGEVKRADLNVTTSGSAVIAKAVAGTNIALSSTGPDAGTGDVTFSITGQVAVANGGTGASTLTANNVILGNGTSAVQFVAPGTSGNVLTSNGTTWQSTAPAASSPSVTLTWADTFRVSSVLAQVTNQNTGENSIGSTYGLVERTSSTAGRYHQTGINIIGDLYANNPKFNFVALGSDLNASSGDGAAYLGLGLPTVSASDFTWTDKHIGIKVIKSGGTVTVYASQANGTTETASSLFTLSNNEHFEVTVEVTSGTSATYKWRKQSSTSLGSTTLSTNMPAASSQSTGFGSDKYMSFGVTNKNTAVAFQFTILEASYNR